MKGNTLFVRNLRYSATKETLEKVFGVYGPLKNYFVVQDSSNVTSITKIFYLVI